MTLKEQLLAIGLTDQQANSTDTVLRNYISGQFVPKDRMDEVLEKNKTLAQDLGRAETEKETLEKRAQKLEKEVAPLQTKIQELDAQWKDKYTALETTHKEAEEKRIATDVYNTRVTALKNALGDSAHDIEMVIKEINLDKLELKDGKVSGVEQAIEQVKTDKAFLFVNDQMYPTAPPRSAIKQDGSTADFGKILAEKASVQDATTEAATKKYFS